MRSFALALLAALLVCPGVGWGADGDSVAGCTSNKNDFKVSCFLLCDTKDSTDTSCTEFDTIAKAAAIPSKIRVARDTTTGCSADPTVEVNFSTTTGGTEHTIGTLNSATTAFSYDGAIAQFINVDLSNMTDCTDLDVHIQLYFDKTGVN